MIETISLILKLFFTSNSETLTSRSAIFDGQTGKVQNKEPPPKFCQALCTPVKDLHCSKVQNKSVHDYDINLTTKHYEP
ncbi:hypothetical protein HYC85_016309 [Camellia sinensis]|uniref:Uncharacterized protein n=1 Tax=Camellia sinensis TaxID=4442 RepID=A0A7J7H1E6_CAMSI|nr:hypothetical protein HYC85_016309 [Camellia sinensis]